MRVRVIGIGRGYGDSGGAVDLVKGHEPGGWMYGVDCAPAVFGDCGAIVARAEAHVQAGQYAGGNAATPTEKAVRNGSKRSGRSEEHTSELQSLMRISYAVFCLKKKKKNKKHKH